MLVLYLPLPLAPAKSLKSVSVEYGKSKAAQLLLEDTSKLGVLSWEAG